MVGAVGEGRSGLHRQGLGQLPSDARSAPAPSTTTRWRTAGRPIRSLTLNGNVRMNGRHPAKGAAGEASARRSRADASPPAPVTPIPDIAASRRRAGDVRRLHSEHRHSAAALARRRRRAGRAGHADGPQIPDRQQPALATSTSSAWRPAAAARIMPATPSRRRSSPPASPSISAATASPPAPACSTALRRQPASLFQIDEFGQFLGSIIDKRRAPKHLAEIRDLLTELSTSAGSTFFGAEYADQKLKPREDIIQPCCAIHATTVPETFWTALRSGSLQDGSLARFLIFRSTDDIPDRNRRRSALSDVPPAADRRASGRRRAALRGFSRRKPRRHRGAHRHAGSLSGADGAGRRAAVRRAGRDRSPTVSASHRLAATAPCWPASWENTAKVALIKAVSADPAAPDDPHRGRRMGPRCRRPLRRDAADPGRAASRRQRHRAQPQAGARKSFATPATARLDQERPLRRRSF